MPCLISLVSLFFFCTTLWEGPLTSELENLVILNMMQTAHPPRKFTPVCVKLTQPFLTKISKGLGSPCFSWKGAHEK